jgi:hypothetical protein
LVTATISETTYLKYQKYIYMYDDKGVSFTLLFKEFEDVKKFCTTVCLFKYWLGSKSKLESFDLKNENESKVKILS